MKGLIAIGMALVFFGCTRRNHVAYYDLSARTDVPGGVFSGLATTDSQDIVVWGGFSGSNIVIAFSNLIPDTVLVLWREGSIADRSTRLCFRCFLPPLDTNRQKYHAQFWFHPGGKVDVKVDTLPIGDCSYTDSFGKTSIPQYGPCSVTGRW
jgi:hypothetical protein